MRTFRLLTLLFVSLVVFAAQVGLAFASDKRVALIIANSNYANTPALSTPPLDATAIQKTLESLEFDRIDLVVDATGDELRKRLRDFSLKARLSDVAVLYYAGHGVEFEGQNYLVPVNARLEQPEDVGFEAVGIDLAVRAVSGAKHLKLLILDACREAPFAGLSRGASGRALNPGLAAIEAAGDVLVSYSAEAGKVAFDGAPGTNSPFAKALSQHLRAPGVDIRQVLGRVRDEVLKSTNQKQKPFIYASLGGEPIFLLPPPTQAQPIATSPIIVDLTVADPKDETIASLAKIPDNAFGYALSTVKGPTNTDGRLQLSPLIDHFTSVLERGRPLIMSKSVGYFDAIEPEGAWGIGQPLIDVIARRATPKVITLTELVLDIQNSAPDFTPYIGILRSGVDYAGLYLINEGWSDVRSATLEFDIVGLERPSLKDIDARISAGASRGFPLRANVGAFQDYAFLPLKAQLATWSEFKFIEHARARGDGESPKRLPRSPAGFDAAFAAWAKVNNPTGPFVSRHRDDGLWIVGRLTVVSQRAVVPPVINDVVASVPVHLAEAGGGDIDYNLVNAFMLRTESGPYSLKKTIGYLLDQDTKTFRGLFPLGVAQTSRHQLRFQLKGDGGAALYQSPPIDAHIVVPRIGAKLAAWQKVGRQGKPPLRGIGNTSVP